MDSMWNGEGTGYMYSPFHGYLPVPFYSVDYFTIN